MRRRRGSGRPPRCAAAGVLSHHDRAVLGDADGVEQRLYLGAAQDDRQLHLLTPNRQVIDLGLALERDGVEEDESGANLAVGLARDLLLPDHVKQVLADLVVTLG